MSISHKEDPLPLRFVKIIGIGGAGCKIIGQLMPGTPETTFAAIDTDSYALKELDDAKKINIRTREAYSFAPEEVHKMALEKAGEIEDLFNDGTMMAIIIAPQGGTTGAEVATVVAEIAKKKGILTIAIVTLPLVFEGEKRTAKALKGIKQLAPLTDSLITIDTPGLIMTIQGVSFAEAFEKVDEAVKAPVTAITRALNNSLVAVDYWDFDTLFRNGGNCICTQGKGHGPDRVKDAIDAALNSPLVNKTDILKAKDLLLLISFNQKASQPMLMSETANLTAFVDSINTSSDCIWGCYDDPSLDNDVKITIFATALHPE